MEVRIRDDSTIRVDRILTAVRQLLEHQYESVALETALPAADWAEYPLLHDNVDRIYVAEAALTGTDSLLVQLSDYDVCIHVYQPLPFDTPLEQFSAAATGATSASQVSRQGGIGAVEDETDPDDDVMAASVLELPSQTIEGQWEALVYDSSIKTDMLNVRDDSQGRADGAVHLHHRAAERQRIAVQHHRLSPARAPSRSARHRQDLALPRVGAEAGHPHVRPVRVR